MLDDVPETPGAAAVTIGTDIAFGKVIKVLGKGTKLLWKNLDKLSNPLHTRVQAILKKAESGQELSRADKKVLTEAVEEVEQKAVKNEYNGGNKSVNPKPTRKPPVNLDDAIDRLGQARKRLAAKGFKSKYTDDQLTAKGQVNDRYVVRFMETKYAKNDSYLGPMTDGKVRYWSTTFDQIENADTDPKRISESVGLDYDPSKEYKLAVIDTADAAKYGDSYTIIPTLLFLPMKSWESLQHQN